jgi:hypothetical protein
MTICASRGRGYDGGYDAVRRYAKRWAKGRGQSTAAAYVPLSFALGEAYQFDWSHAVVLLSGVTVIVKAAHVRRRLGSSAFTPLPPPQCVDVTHGLVLLFGLGTKALPSWDSKTRCNNLCRGLAVRRTAGPSGQTALSTASPANRSRGLIKCAKESARYRSSISPV